MTLQQKTKEIILDSIKSAIFIDEKALEAYKKKPLVNYPELNLSISLFNNFKKKGVSLTIHKFNPTDIDNVNSLNYFFKRRDLILLDWRLDGDNGEEYSLKLLSKIIKERHIHFCSIFTSDPNMNEIINNVVTYFSGYDNNYYQNIKEELDVYQNDNVAIFNQVSFDNIVYNKSLYKSFNDIDDSLPNLIRDVTGLSNFGDALIQVKYAFSQYHKSDEPHTIPTHINRVNFTLNINNTIITIIPKSENSATKILKRLVDQISKSENNLSQLLGLDMQNSFTNNNSFIDENLLNTNLDTLMFHRKQLKKNNLDIEFQNFIKSILIEHSKMKLEDSTLKILEDSFLDKISKKKYKINDSEIAVLNTFYNGSYLPNKSILNFADIFKDSQNNFYLCITALCDCVIHNGKSSIDFKYFFVKGQKIPTSVGISKGDGGFISYLDKKTCISWAVSEYVKPIQLYVPEPKLNNNKIIIFQWDKDNNSISHEIEYVFSLKQNYAQRIANHTFAHPIRVGVDFVKK